MHFLKHICNNRERIFIAITSKNNNRPYRPTSVGIKVPTSHSFRVGWDATLIRVKRIVLCNNFLFYCPFTLFIFCSVPFSLYPFAFRFPSLLLSICSALLSLYLFVLPLSATIPLFCPSLPLSICSAPLCLYPFVLPLSASFYLFCPSLPLSICSDPLYLYSFCSAPLSPLSPLSLCFPLSASIHLLCPSLPLSFVCTSLPLCHCSVPPPSIHVG